MSLILDRCVEYDEHRKICVASELGKTYTLNNLSDYKVKKIKVDKCIEQAVNEKRCDYLMHVVKDGDQSAFFIELKGGALVDAVKQLCDTIDYFSAELKDCKINARIVGSRDTPNIQSSPLYRKLNRIVENSKGTIRRGTNKVLTDNI